LPNHTSLGQNKQNRLFSQDWSGFFSQNKSAKEFWTRVVLKDKRGWKYSNYSYVYLYEDILNTSVFIEIHYGRHEGFANVLCSLEYDIINAQIIKIRLKVVNRGCMKLWNLYQKCTNSINFANRILINLINIFKQHFLYLPTFKIT